jgi:hypothetical protein
MTSRKPPKSTRSPTPRARKPRAKPVKLLAGGNPQIAKADGEAAVLKYLDAMPGWKRSVGHKLDALIVSALPAVQKAVKWNSPFYGVAGQGWFLSFHCVTKYIKVAFFRGASLTPMPLGESTQPHVRYHHVYESTALDEAQFVDWVRQAAALPGWLS